MTSPIDEHGEAQREIDERMEFDRNAHVLAVDANRKNMESQTALNHALVQREKGRASCFYSLAIGIAVVGVSLMLLAADVVARWH